MCCGMWWTVSMLWVSEDAGVNGIGAAFVPSQERVRTRPSSSSSSSHRVQADWTCGCRRPIHLLLLLRGHAGLDKEAQARRRGRRRDESKKQEDKQNTQTNPIEERSGSSDQVDFFLVKLNTG